MPPMMTPAEFKEGEALFEQGATCDVFYLLTKGAVKLEHRLDGVNAKYKTFGRLNLRLSGSAEDDTTDTSTLETTVPAGSLLGDIELLPATAEAPKYQTTATCTSPSGCGYIA
eukprot:12785949-Prorocentrum_lima.AAC.1